MKLILAVATFVALLSLCNLSDKIKPAANTNGNPNTTAEKPAAEPNREAVRDELLRLEKELTDASFSGDISVLARYIADDYVGTSADGTTQNKNQLLGSVKPDKVTKSWTITEPELVSLSKDFAVLTYVQTQFLRNGRSGRARITDTFVKRDGRWLVQSEQQTMMK